MSKGSFFEIRFFSKASQLDLGGCHVLVFCRAFQSFPTAFVTQRTQLNSTAMRHMWRHMPRADGLVLAFIHLQVLSKGAELANSLLSAHKEEQQICIYTSSTYLCEHYITKAIKGLQHLLCYETLVKHRACAMLRDDRGNRSKVQATLEAPVGSASLAPSGDRCLLDLLGVRCWDRLEPQQGGSWQVRVTCFFEMGIPLSAGFGVRLQICSAHMLACFSRFSLWGAKSFKPGVTNGWCLIPK